MAKNEEKKMEIKVDVLSAENNLKKVKDDLSLILKDSEAVNRAIAEANQHNKEGAMILGEALASEGVSKLLGPLGAVLDLYVDLSIHSKKSISFFERIQNQLIAISKAEHQYMLAQVEIGNLVEAEAENKIAQYTRNEEYQRNIKEIKIDEQKAEIRNLGIRENAHKKIKKLHQEELNNLDENRAAYTEINDAINRINSQKGRSLAIQVALGGKNIKIEQKYANLSLKNLETRKRTYATKISLAEKAQIADWKAQQFHEESLIKAEESAARKAQQANDEKSRVEEELKSQEKRFDRLEKLQIRAEDDLKFKGELQNREVEGIKAREAIQIQAIDKDTVLQQQKNDIQEESQSEQLELIESNNQEVEQAEADSHKTRAEQWKEYAEKVSAISQQISEVTGMVTSSLGGMFGQLAESYSQQVEELTNKISALDEEKEAALERVSLSEEERSAKEEELAQQKIDLEYATSEEQKNKADERIATLQGELGAEDSINRDFESKKASLEKEKAKKEKEQQKAEKMQKRLQMGQAIVEAVGNIAQGAAKALAMGPILGPILAAVVSAAGAIQVGIMTKQLAKMGDGGLLSGKRHSQGGMRILGSNIEVEGGEYVMNRQTTQKNLGLMEYINSQRKTLNPNDINSYFGQPFSMPTFTPSPFAEMMKGDQVVPMLSPTDSVDTKILNAIEKINFQPRVSVTDINTVHDNMVKVDEWTGL